MHELFRTPSRRFVGEHLFPEMPYLRRSFADLIDDIKAYYYRFPKRVDADNILGNLLVHIPVRMDMDDRRYLRFVEDVAQGVSRAFGITSSTYKGKVHERGVTLGEKTNEVLISHHGDTDISNAKATWRTWSPLTYLYHTRIDLGLPVLNNKSPGKGHGVSVIDIPLMALQYRYWLKHQASITDQKESVYRFIGGFVLPNTLESYTDIAFFNRLARLSLKLPTQRFPTPHPFYVTDYSARVDALCEKIIATQEHRSGDIEQVVYTTPVLVQRRLWDTMQLPKGPVTRANDWALQIARLPYIKYIVETSVHSDRGDRTYLNQLYLSLIEANQDNIFTGVGSPDVVKHYRMQIRDLIALMENKRQGWT